MSLVGVLAFQGDFSEHHQILKDLEVASIDVRNLEDLAKVSALIIPGGESTVIAKFLEETGVGREVVRRVTTVGKGGKEGMEGKGSKVGKGGKGSKEGKGGEFMSNKGSRYLPAVDSQGLSVFGTCAGAIVLARKATGKNAPKTLGLIDVTIDRNAYGSQVDSFETAVKVTGIRNSVDVAFIRAPKITSVGRGVEVLANHKGLPVLVRQGSVMIATFHPEVRGQTLVHRLFLQQLSD